MRLRGMWIASSLAVTLPFIFVGFPPGTDLPQLVSQTHVLGRTLAGHTDVYTIAWWAPNSLFYAVLGGTALLFAPPLSATLALLVFAWLWVAASFYLASRLGRPPEHAVLASILVFNAGLYWGLLSFLIGWPVFALWLCVSRSPMSRATWRKLVGLSLLLYASHALWFVLGGIWLAIACAFDRTRTWRAIAYQLSALAPGAVATAIWYPSLLAARQSALDGTTPRWLVLPYERLRPDYLFSSTLKGVRGPLEPFLMSCLLAWILLAVLTNRRDLRGRIDGRLLACAAMFGGLALLAPDQYIGTLLFAVRWLPCAAICLLLGLPAPRFDRRILLTCALGLVCLGTVVTARIWYVFERTELTGLAGALRALPESQRVVGLDFVKTSALLQGRPFLQTFAYAQAMKAAALNFSFVEHSGTVVRYRTVPPAPWTPGLEWFAERLKADDLNWFDYALVNATPNHHAVIATDPRMRAITNDGRWRLYRIVTASRRSGARGRRRARSARPRRASRDGA